MTKKNLWEARKERVSESLHDNIKWSSVRYHKKPLVLSTVYDLFKIKTEVKRIIESQTIGLIHVRSYPPMGIALWAKKKVKCKVLFDIRGFYADERVEGQLWSLNNPLHRYLYKRLKGKERVYMTKADGVVTLTNAAKTIVHQKWNLPESSIWVIPCCADFEFFKPFPESRESVFTIVYLGSLGTWYLSRELMLALKAIKDVYPQVKLRVISHDNHDELIALAQEIGVDQQTLLTGGAEREQLPAELSKSSLALFFIRPSFSKQASSPTKLGELLACGIPVISNKGVGDMEMLAEELIGLEVIDTQAISSVPWAELVESLLSYEPNEIRESARERMSLAEGIKKYQAVYTSILGS